VCLGCPCKSKRERTEKGTKSSPQRGLFMGPYLGGGCPSPIAFALCSLSSSSLSFSLDTFLFFSLDTALSLLSLFVRFPPLQPWTTAAKTPNALSQTDRRPLPGQDTLPSRPQPERPALVLSATHSRLLQQRRPAPWTGCSTFCNLYQVPMTTRPSPRNQCY